MARQPEDVVRQANDLWRTSYTVVGRMAGGRQGGAWRVSDETGVEAVLTVTDHPGLVARRPVTTALVGRLAAVGYPTPRWLHHGVVDGWAVVIAELVAGKSPSWELFPLDATLTAISLQQGVASDSGGPSWSGYLEEALARPDGIRGDIASLGDVSHGFLTLVDEARRAMTGAHLPREDAVHGDFEVGNLLVDHDGQVHIIDVGAMGPGTRAIDIAWLFRDAASHDAPAAVTGRIRDEGIAVAGHGAWRACVALACTELVAFIARVDSAPAARGSLARYSEILAMC